MRRSVSFSGFKRGSLWHAWSEKKPYPQTHLKWIPNHWRTVRLLSNVRSGIDRFKSKPNRQPQTLLYFHIQSQILPILFVNFFCYQSSYFHFYYPRTIISCLDGSLPCSRLMCSPNKLVFIHKHVPLPVLPMSLISTPCIQPARWWITCRAMKQGYHTSLKTELSHVNSKMGQTEPRKCSCLRGG